MHRSRPTASAAPDNNPAYVLYGDYIDPPTIIPPMFCMVIIPPPDNNPAYVLYGDYWRLLLGGQPQHPGGAPVKIPLERRRRR